LSITCKTALYPGQIRMAIRAKLWNGTEWMCLENLQS
jgi:L-cysteine desulfidase